MHNVNSDKVAEVDNSQVFNLNENHSDDRNTTGLHPRVDNTDLIDGKNNVQNVKTTSNKQDSEPAADQKTHDIHCSSVSSSDYEKSPVEILESEEAMVYNIPAAELSHNFDMFKKTLNEINPSDDSNDLGDWSWDVDESMEALCVPPPQTLADVFRQRWDEAVLWAELELSQEETLFPT